MRKLRKYTLASSGKAVLVDRDNIAFAMEMEVENEGKEKITFTRIALKQLDIDDDAKWVDVMETIDEI